MPITNKMSQYFSAIVCVLLLAGSALGQATIPFDFKRGLVEVEVLIDGRIKARLGIDTGADRLYLDDDFAKANNLKISGPSTDRAIVGVGGSTRGQAAELRSLAIGDQRLYNLNATVIDLAALVGSGSEHLRGLDGLIGHEVLQRFYITVDYPGKTLTIQTTQPEFLSSGKFDEVRFSRSRHLLLVDATINGEVETPMILDYCASHTSLDLSLARGLGFDQPVGQVVTLDKISLSEAITSDSVYAAIADLGGLRGSAHRSTFGGMLGGSFLYRYKITVDYKREKIYFHLR